MAYGVYLAALGAEAHLHLVLGWLVPAASLGPLCWILLRDHRPTVPTELGLARGRIGRSLLTLALCSLAFLPIFYLVSRIWPALLGDGGTSSVDLPRAIYQQLIQIALLEEAFFRGYLQGRLDLSLGRPRRLFGADVGWGLPITAALFAAAHLVAVPHPLRLLVFFPGLIFGWMRSCTGAIWAGVLFHALCNIYLDYLTGRITPG